ncbi:MAG: hypothetical protein AAF943_03905 [Pseudomonadota bacterium]
MMDVTVHLGAHRTATTSFQHYAQDQEAFLAAERVAVWGPKRTRQSVFPGFFRNARAKKGRDVAQRAAGRLRLHMAQAENQGVERLLISDENLLGTPIDMLRQGRLYPAAGERVARLAQALDTRFSSVVLSIRSLDLWWASICALSVSRGHPMPSSDDLRAIAAHRRGWRDVVTDIACAIPEGAEIKVLPFERFAGQPEALLSTALSVDAPADGGQRWLNRSADLDTLRSTFTADGRDAAQLPDEAGRWQPFEPEQIALLRELYADDMHWLVAGADGLATSIEERSLTRADTSASQAVTTKGHFHDTSQGQLAQDG